MFWQTWPGLHCLGVHLRSGLPVAASFGFLQWSLRKARGLWHLHVQRVDQRLRCGPGMGEITGTGGKPPRHSLFLVVDLSLIWSWFEFGCCFLPSWSIHQQRFWFWFGDVWITISNRPRGFHHSECGSVRVLRCGPVAGGPGDAGLLRASWDGRFQCAPGRLPLGCGAGAAGRDEP